uniref:CYRIA/CYRIB Rac1 binding domain-containing protein n=9 Tax=Passeriformes TaxID=9126 RepID=U3JCP9_FICAL
MLWRGHQTPKLGLWGTIPTWGLPLSMRDAQPRNPGEWHDTVGVTWGSPPSFGDARVGELGCLRGGSMARVTPGAQGSQTLTPLPFPPLELAEVLGELSHSRGCSQGWAQGGAVLVALGGSGAQGCLASGTGAVPLCSVSSRSGLLAMGNLIKVLGKDLENCPHFFLDFENAQPTEAETAVWNQVNAVLEEAQTILAELQSYTGAGQEIREAIQNPGDLRLQERAWSAVCPLVAKLKRFYEFSLRLENALRSLLEALTSPPYAPTQHLEREQALAKQFAEILHFTLSFDELKMTNPAIQNDFSYYRRTISRNRINNLQLDAESEVNNEMANRMSLFYAEATPMLKTLSNATTKFVSENKTLPIEDTTDCLSTMACVCRVMLETPEYRSRFTNTETLLFCMRVMVGVIILYDHVHPVGAFAKTSKIDMKGCIKVLKDQPSTSTEGLLNALRYTTRHLNDDTTSKQIRALLQ